jgi:predicted dehydrogenase
VTSSALQLGVFGLGLIGRRHLAIAAEVPECRVVAAADVNVAERATAESRGIKFYGDFRELLDRERLDGVIIATPNATHVELGLECVARGLPILVEKPISDTVESARALLSAATAADVPVAVGHHRRFDPSVEMAKTMLDAGDLGDLTAMQVIWALRKHDAYYETAWRTSRDTGGGPGLINLIHDIDLMRHFAGDVERVYAELGHQARDWDVEDSIGATVRFTSGVIGSLLTSDATPSPWGWEQGSGENPDVPASTAPGAAVADWRTTLVSQPIEHGPRAALHRQLADFCAVLRREKAPRVSGVDAYASLAATLAVIRSGETAEVVYPESIGETSRRTAEQTAGVS